jgi:hypothetical protein
MYPNLPISVDLKVQIMGFAEQIQQLHYKKGSSYKFSMKMGVNKVEAKISELKLLSTSGAKLR